MFQFHSGNLHVDIHWICRHYITLSYKYQVIGRRRNTKWTSEQLTSPSRIYLNTEHGCVTELGLRTSWWQTMNGNMEVRSNHKMIRTTHTSGCASQIKLLQFSWTLHNANSKQKKTLFVVLLPCHPMEHPATPGQKPSCDWTLTDYYLNYIRISLCITKTYRKLCSIPCSNFTTFWYQNSFTVPYVGTLNLHHSICLHHSNYPVSDVASQISKINSTPHTPSYPLGAWVWGYIHRWSCPTKAWSTRSNEWCSHLL